METLVKTFFPKHTIVRIGNILWGSNPNTLINFMRNKIKNKEVFDIQDVYRYIVDRDEFIYWIKRIPEWSCEINVPGRRMKVVDIIYEYCRG
jgi:dTDP-4-dehydrorhamnose reductase